MTVTWVNGQIIDDIPALVGPYDPGLLVGDGLFETIAVYDGSPYALGAHLNRLERSARVLDLLGYERDALERGIAQTLSAWKQPGLGRMRVTIWRSASELGLFPSQSTISCAVSVVPGHGPLLGETNPEGAVVATSAFVRNERSAITGHKSTSYAENLYALKAARVKGANEAIIYNTVGDLSEGATSNAIMELEGELLTPALPSGCLPGITRHKALQLAARAGIPAREVQTGELTRERVAHALASGGSAALLGTMRNLQHIERWDDLSLTAGSLLCELEQLLVDDMARQVK